MRFTDLRISIRLSLGFAAVIVASVAIAVVGRIALGNVGDELRLFAEDRLVKVSDVRDIKEGVAEIGQQARNIALLSDDARRGTEARAIEAQRKRIVERLERLQKMITTDKGKAILARLVTARGSYNEAVDQAVAAGLAGQAAAARDQLINVVAPRQKAYFEVLDELIAYQTALMDDAKKATEADVEHAGRLMLAIAFVAAVVGALWAWWVSRSITQPLSGAVDATRKIAAGTLDVPIDTRGRDEVGELLQSLDAMQTSLRSIVTRVRASVESVATASAQIAAGNQDLSSRTEQQASSLQETAASMEQLTGTVTQSADSARQANQLARAAADSARRGGDVVLQVVSTMGEISSSSKRIAEIIGVIDGIAFQTNILALNASVEAARAGEQGRGFAVVAGEVRTLAQRSSQAAREIRGLITDATGRVDAGSTQVTQAGQVMQDIVTQVQRVNDLIGEISSAATEQSSGIGQINEAVTQMDQVTQQNAALVEQSAAAAQSLKDLAAQLSQAVSQFRYDDSDRRLAVA
jgi:methyl-accepting chemotaxis protein